MLIAAAGNAGAKSPPLFPGADPLVIAVTATDVDDKLFTGANRGKYISVAAPGVDILVPAPENTYQITTGTSVAAAEVSGIVALLLERNPKLTPADVRRILQASARRLGAGERDDNFGPPHPIMLTHRFTTTVPARGKYISVAAPGVDILVPAPANASQLTTGTSVAAAEVSGIVALLLERNPKLTPADIRRILTSSAKRLGARRSRRKFRLGLSGSAQGTTARYSANRYHNSRRRRSSNVWETRRNSKSNGIVAGDRHRVVEAARRRVPAPRCQSRFPRCLQQRR